MRKKFSLTSPNKKPDRQVEAVKAEIKKYIARERRKELPDHFDTWFFDCRIGENDQSHEAIKISEINKSIDQLVSSGKESFYIEILAKPSAKPIRE